MLSKQKSVNIEWIGEKSENVSYQTNPIRRRYVDTTDLSALIAKVIEDEIPRLKNNSLLFDLVMYTVLEDLKTVQSVENVLSYIKKSDAKQVQDVSFKNGEIFIQCLI